MSNVEEVLCKVCDGGVMQKKKTHRLGPVVAVIGYIFLIPSFIGMLFGLLALVGAVLSFFMPVDEDVQESLRAEGVEELKLAGLPQGIIDKFASGQEVSSGEKNALPDVQRQALVVSEFTVNGSAEKLIGGTLGSVFGTIMVVLSFVGGLFGWLLVMKKKILQCSMCSATIAAS